MNYLDVFLFIVKYIPFWAIPLGLTAAHFSYLFWLKDYRDLAYIWGSITLFSLTVVIIYIAMGGPDQITRTFVQIFS